MRTLLLDRTTWDLVPNAFGNIAVADEPYALAQDAASAIKLFYGELYYNTAVGVPYFTTILGQAPPLLYIKAQFNLAALTVPGVVAAQSFIESFIDRKIKGQVQVTNEEGVIMTATF